MKGLLAALLSTFLVGLAGHGAPGTGSGGKGFLDLPSGFGMSEDDEDEPELIDFYNDEYEGDAFVFCLDRSSSMGETTAGGQTKFQVLKQETTRAISGLTARSVVSVVFYDFQDRPLVYGDPPMKMTMGGKAQMIGQILSTPLSHGSCMARGATRALELAAKAKNEHRTMILTSDGRTQCPSDVNDSDAVFARIMSSNPLRIPINTVYTGPQQGEDWTIGKPLLERLARATNVKSRVAQ